MFQVSVRFFASLAARFGDSKTVQIEPGSRVWDLFRLLGIQEADVSICVVDGTQVTPDAPLHNGAEVMLIPVVVGG